MSEEYVADYAGAVLPVFAWVNSNHWLQTFASHFQEFYSNLSAMIEAPAEDVIQALPTPFFTKAVRAVFDDFLTIEYDQAPKNALDQYLDEVGESFMEADVDYLVAFRRSVVRVYHVVERMPYKSVVLRELSGGDKPIEIRDELLTSALSPGDKIATRIVTVNEEAHLAGPILVLDPPTLAGFEMSLAQTLKGAMREAPKYLRNSPQHRNTVRQRLLNEAGPVLSTMWVMSVLAAFEEISLANDDDPNTMFQGSIPYPEVEGTLVECLDALPDLERPIPQELVWIWRMPGEDPEASIKALLWLSGPDILLESCERSRLEEVAETLSGLLGEALGEMTIEDLDVDDDEFDEDEDEEEDDDSDLLLPVPRS